MFQDSFLRSGRWPPQKHKDLGAAFFGARNFDTVGFHRNMFTWLLASTEHYCQSLTRNQQTFLPLGSASLSCANQWHTASHACREMNPDFFLEAWPFAHTHTHTHTHAHGACSLMMPGSSIGNNSSSLGGKDWKDLKRACANMIHWWIEGPSPMGKLPPGQRMWNAAGEYLAVWSLWPVCFFCATVDITFRKQSLKLVLVSRVEL